MFKGSSICEHTGPAVLEYTLVSVRVAVPTIKSPPPYCQPWIQVTFQRSTVDHLGHYIRATGSI